MTPERFRAIVDAYGTDARRWPAAERADASAWAQRHRSEADALLAEAAQVDAWLASHNVEAPDAAFIERVVASAPASAPAASATDSVRKQPRWFTLPGWRSRRAGLWWSGAAFAGVGLIGGFAGAFAVSFFLVTGTPSPGSESSYLTTGFGGTAADWSGE